MKSYRLEMRDFRRIIDVIEKEIDLSEVLYSIGVAENPKIYKEPEFFYRNSIGFEFYLEHIDSTLHLKIKLNYIEFNTKITLYSMKQENAIRAIVESMPISKYHDYSILVDRLMHKYPLTDRLPRDKFLDILQTLLALLAKKAHHFITTATNTLCILDNGVDFLIYKRHNGFEINLYYEGFKYTYTGKAEFSFVGLAECLKQAILQITRRLDKPIYEPLNDKLATAVTQACFMETNTPNAVIAIKHFSEVVKLIQAEDNAKKALNIANGKAHAKAKINGGKNGTKEN